MTQQIETVEDQPHTGWKPLTWGQTWGEFKEDWPYAVANEISLGYDEYYSVKLDYYSNITIFNFLGDCGGNIPGSNTFVRVCIFDNPNTCAAARISIQRWMSPLKTPHLLRRLNPPPLLRNPYDKSILYGFVS
jgi:hypothetical protein